MKKSKEYLKLEKKYKRVLNLLDVATDWASEVIGGDEETMKEESPTMYYVCKEFEKLTS